MPLNLDSCIAGVFVPGNIGASSGLPPVAPTVPSFVGPAPAIVETAIAGDTLDYFMGVLLHEAAAATATVNVIFAGTTGIVETATATDTVAVQVSVTHTASITETGEALDQFFEQEPVEFNDTITETATATDTVATGNIHVVSISEAVSATDAPDWEAEALVARDEMIAGPRLVMLSSDGTSRDAMVDAIMVNE